MTFYELLSYLFYCFNTNGIEYDNEQNKLLYEIEKEKNNT
jgi:hypothetical protein